MTDRPIIFSAPMVRAILAGTKMQTRRIVKPQPKTIGDGAIKCPYGRKGDRLWVRENFGIDDEDGSILYWADPDTAEAALEARMCEYRFPRCRPSIHMPRSASRIMLEITGVRVERLNDTSRGDAMAEGCPFADMAAGPDTREWYRGLWEQINGPGSWSANPWVWVLEFQRSPDLRPNV